MVKNVFMKETNISPAKKAETIAFVHIKGGTGKTTSALNVAGWLKKMKQKVLVVDMDPQGSATAGLGVDKKTIDTSMYHVLFEQKDMNQIMLETNSGVFLAPSSIDLLSAEINGNGLNDNLRVLSNSLVDVENYFDYILLDLPPGSNFLMINGIVAAQNIIIPMNAGIFSFETLEILKTLIIELDEDMQVETNLQMILLREYFSGWRYRKVKKLLKEFLIENNISDVKIFKVPFSERVFKSQIKGMPISHCAPFSGIGRKYKKIAKYVLASKM